MEAFDGPVADVQGCVVVGVVAPSAAFAVEARVVAVACVHVAAPVAALAGVGGVDHEDADVVADGLVGGELLQLAEAPLVEHVASASADPGTFPRLAANVGQILERDVADAGRGCQSFGFAMVDVADEPLFPSLHRLQPAVCGSGAFFLQGLPVMRVPAFHAPDVVRFAFTSPRVHGQ